MSDLLVNILQRLSTPTTPMKLSKEEKEELEILYLEPLRKKEQKGRYEFLGVNMQFEKGYVSVRFKDTNTGKDGEIFYSL